MKRSVLILLLIATTLASMLNIRAQQGSLATDTASTQQEAKATNYTGNDNKSIEQQRLDLERQKFESDTRLEKEKIQIEREKLTAIPWTAFSTIVPLLAVLFTIGYSVWSFRKQNEQQNAQRRADTKQLEKQRAEDARLQFEMKAAEIAFAGETPLAVGDRAKALKAMFVSRLPDNFLSDYDPHEFGEKEGNVESKKFFLELLLKYPDQQLEILYFWKEIFPGDVDWLRRVHLSPHVVNLKPSESGSALQTDITANKTSAETKLTATPSSAGSSKQTSPDLPDGAAPSDSTISNKNSGAEE